MHTQPDQPWPDEYYGLFGKRLDDDEVTAIERSVRHVFTNLRAWEMGKAVRAAARAQSGKHRKFPPSGQEIIECIKLSRAEYAARNQANGHVVLRRKSQDFGRNRIADVTTSEREDAELWRAELKADLTPEQRWSVICRPAHDEQCAERQKFCDDNGLPYEIFAPGVSYEERLTIRAIGQEVAV